MEEYLTVTREALTELDNYERIHVVLGNESCDIDSTISSLVYAYYLYTIDEDDGVLYLPLMQIPRSKFRLRLESIHFLDKIGIEADILTFSDDISLLELHTKGKLLLTLVDHHVLTHNLSVLENSVVKVIDHRPVDKEWPSSCKIIIEPVGSCCTLIAEEILSNDEFPFDGIANVLLYGTILVDTINMSPEAGKTTEKDRAMIEQLEDSLEEMGVERDTLYEDLIAAKFDLSGLTTSEILDKDVKLIHSSNLIVAMSSITMEMKDMFTKEDLEVELQRFSEINKAEVVVLMMLGSRDGIPTRQLALYSNNRIYRQQIMDVLLANSNPSLQLEITNSPFENIISYNQNNVQASRKKVLPIIKEFLNGESSFDESATTSPDDRESYSSVTGAMADSGKGESDHEQHFLSNETMSPEVVDIFDPFSPQSNTLDSAEKNISQSDLVRDFDNELSKLNLASNGLPSNGINNSQQLHKTNELNTNNIIDAYTTSNDSFGSEAAVNQSSLSINRLAEENTGTINNIVTTPQTNILEDDNFELTEADMYMSGLESPMYCNSGQNSGQASKTSSYPVTPPNSFLDTDFLNKQHNLPSFNNSEMVKIIKAKQASMGKCDSENNSDENGENQEPFTPANSYIGDSFENYAKETSLPSLYNAELVQTVRKKRASLDYATEGDKLDVDPFPFAPHNSYVDRSLDQFVQIAGADLSQRLSEETLNTQADQFTNSDFIGFQSSDTLSALPTLNMDSKNSTHSDLLSMGYSKSGSSDTESTGDTDSPKDSRSAPPVLLESLNPFSHYKDQDDNVEGLVDSSSNVVASQLVKQMSSDLQGNDMPSSEDLFVNFQTESDTSYDTVASQVAHKMLSEQMTEDLFSNLLSDSNLNDSDNVVASQLADKISLIDSEDLFKSLVNINDVESGSNIIAPIMAEQMSSAQLQQPQSVFSNGFSDSDTSTNVVASQMADEMICGQQSNQKLGDGNLFNNVIQESEIINNVVASQLADKISLNYQIPSSELLIDSESSNNNVEIPSSENLFNNILSDPESTDNVAASQLADQITIDYLSPSSDLLADPFPSNNLAPSEISKSEDLLTNIPSNQDSNCNFIATQLAQNTFTKAEGYLETHKSSPPVLSGQSSLELLTDLVEDPSNDNIVASQLAGKMVVGKIEANDDVADQFAEEITTEKTQAVLNDLDNVIDDAFGSDSFERTSAVFDPFSSVVSDDLEKNTTGFDPFASIKSEESLTSPEKRNRNKMDTFACMEQNVPSVNFNPFVNVEENMSSQQEKIFDPYSTISTDGQQLVSGFDDIVDVSNFKSDTNGQSIFDNSNKSGGQDFSNNFSINDNKNPFKDNFVDGNEITEADQSQNQGAIVQSTDVTKSSKSFVSENMPPSLLGKANSLDEFQNSSENFEFLASAPSCASQTSGAGIFKDSTSSIDDFFAQSYSSTSKLVLKPSHIEGLNNSMVHQPSIQSDLSTSFDFNEGNSEIFSDLSPSENKSDSSIKTEELLQLQAEESMDDSSISESKDIHSEDIYVEISNPSLQNVEKSLVGKLKGCEFVHQPSIQSDLSTSFEDKSDYMFSSNPVSPEEVPFTSLTVDPRHTSKPLNLPLATNDVLTKSGIYFPESGVKFVATESDSSVSQNSTPTGSEDDKEPHSLSLTDEKMDADANTCEHSSTISSEIDDSNGTNHLAEEASDLVDPAMEKELLRTSTNLVEAAFKEAIVIEMAHLEEESNEVKPLPSEDEEEDKNTSLNNVDEPTEEQITEAAVNDVAFSYANNLIQEALDIYDEVIDPLATRLSDHHVSLDEDFTSKTQSSLKLIKSNNDISLETDYLPGMDLFRGSLDIYSGTEHSTTISTDAKREVAEGASFRKISCEVSPSLQLEFLEQLRIEAEANRHVEVFNETSSELSLDVSESSDWKSGESGVIENIPAAVFSNEPELFADANMANYDMPKSDSQYDNLANTPSSEEFDPHVSIEPELTTDNVNQTFSSVSDKSMSLQDSSEHYDNVPEEIQQYEETHVSSLLNKCSTDDFECNKLPNQAETSDIKTAPDQSDQEIKTGVSITSVVGEPELVSVSQPLNESSADDFDENTSKSEVEVRNITNAASSIIPEIELEIKPFNEPDIEIKSEYQPLNKSNGEQALIETMLERSSPALETSQLQQHTVETSNEYGFDSTEKQETETKGKVLSAPTDNEAVLIEIKDQEVEDSSYVSFTDNCQDTKNLSSYSTLTDKQKKEVYMTSAGRISIALDKGDSVSGMEDAEALINQCLSNDPRIEDEHRQVGSLVNQTGMLLEHVDAELAVFHEQPSPSSHLSQDKPVTTTTEAMAGDTDVVCKDEWQDDGLPPMIDGEQMCNQDNRTSSLDGAQFDDTPVQSSSSSEPIAEYTAEDEHDDSKHWKVVNIGDIEYRIDLIVIEPYKKVISHGGYYGDELNALIVFSGCYLPDKRRKDYQYVMEHLFVYVVHMLEELVAEDYMIIYFHGATPKKQSPSFGWLKKCYQMIDRRLKKNLKSLFLVHPTLWLRTVVLMTKPFISSKFSSKLKFVKTLQDLGQIIPTQNLNIPDAVKIIEQRIQENPKYLEEEEKREKKLEKEAEKERKKKLKEEKKKKKK